MEIKKITKDNIDQVLDQEGMGFSKEQLSKIKRLLNKVSDTLSGKFTSNGSGGGFYHMFFQLKDLTWIGYHNSSGDVTISKPFKTSKSLYTAFWDDDGVNVCMPYKDEKITKSEFENAKRVIEQWCKEKNCDINFLYPRGK